MSDLTGSQKETNQAEAEIDFAKTAAHLCILLFSLFLLFYGFCIGGLIFKEPDICFLLASGRWIVEHGQLPVTDPFSFTTHFHPVQYVIEKWLTEIIFYDVWAATGATGLLVFDACLLAIAFVIMPMRILYLGGFRGLALLLTVSLATLASFSHLAVRPEVFSFLMAGFFLEILLRISRVTAGSGKIEWRYIALLGLLSCLWSNLHTLFIVAVMLPAMYTGCLVLEKLFIKELRVQPFNWTVPIALFVCLFCTLINPYGIGLWQYIPNVFGPFNDTNNEMQPIGLATVLSPAFYPFYLFAGIALVALIKRLRTLSSSSLQQGDLFFYLLIPAGILGGFKTIRSIPLADLLMVAGFSRVRQQGSLGPSFAQRVNVWLDRFVNPFNFLTPVLCLLICGLGGFLISFAVVPEIPQGSAAFTPPVEAIKYIGAHPPCGHLLNDPHFGNVLMWQLKNSPPVFIDSRYNLYGNGLLQDYWKIVDCKNGWEKLLDKYEIDWLFLPPNLPLTKHLSQLQNLPQSDTGANFKRLFEDKTSVIYGRNQTKGKI
jgi:hypothetical protein